MAAEVEVLTSIGYLLKATTAVLHARLVEALQPWDLTVTEYSTLENLRQRPGISSSELARAVFVTRQGMAAVIRSLEARGLVARDTVAATGRALPTSLTAAGHDVCASASAAAAAVEERMLRGLPTAERTALHRALTSCADSLVDPSSP